MLDGWLCVFDVNYVLVGVVGWQLWVVVVVGVLVYVYCDDCYDFVVCDVQIGQWVG